MQTKTDVDVLPDDPEADDPDTESEEPDPDEEEPLVETDDAREAL